MSHKHDRLLRASTAQGLELSLGTTAPSAAKGLVLPQLPIPGGKASLSTQHRPAAATLILYFSVQLLHILKPSGGPAKNFKSK